MRAKEEIAMPTTDDIYERLGSIFRDVLDDDDLTLRPETTAKDVKGWDSITNVQLMLSIEREFGVPISAGRMQALHNIGDLISLIEGARVKA
jgi:acyl carrier protein